MLVIPEMDPQQGKNWKQPHKDEILFDGITATMPWHIRNQLKVYSNTRPGGVYPGKMWRADHLWVDPNNSDWHLCFYGAEIIHDGRPSCPVHRARIIELDWRALLGITT